MKLKSLNPILLIALSVALLLSSPCLATPPGKPTPALRKIWNDFRRSVLKKDPRGVAEFVEYPLRLRDDLRDQSAQIDDWDEFAKRYRELMLQADLFGAIKSQKTFPFYANPQADQYRLDLKQTDPRGLYQLSLLFAPSPKGYKLIEIYLGPIVAR